LQRSRAQRLFSGKAGRLFEFDGVERVPARAEKGLCARAATPVAWPSCGARFFWYFSCRQEKYAEKQEGKIDLNVQNCFVASLLDKIRKMVSFEAQPQYVSDNF